MGELAVIGSTGGAVEFPALIGKGTGARRLRSRRRVDIFAGDFTEFTKPMRNALRRHAFPKRPSGGGVPRKISRAAKEDCRAAKAI
jgi:hypothetical protein